LPSCLGPLNLGNGVLIDKKLKGGGAPGGYGAQLGGCGGHPPRDPGTLKIALPNPAGTRGIFANFPGDNLANTLQLTSPKKFPFKIPFPQGGYFEERQDHGKKAFHEWGVEAKRMVGGLGGLKGKTKPGHGPYKKTNHPMNGGDPQLMYWCGGLSRGFEQRLGGATKFKGSFGGLLQTWEMVLTGRGKKKPGCPGKRGLGSGFWGGRRDKRGTKAGYRFLNRAPQGGFFRGGPFGVSV